MTVASAKVLPAIGLDCLRRRRGSELEDAIRDAAYDELLSVGYAAFTVEGVAARARTGKASIYRRWPSKTMLILDSLTTNLGCDENDPNMVFGDDVTTAEALRSIAGGIAAILNSPAGDAIRALKADAVADPELAREIDERFQAPRRLAIVGLLERGVQRGEVRPDALCSSVLDVLPAMLTYRVVMLRERLDETAVATIIDDVILPLITT